MSQPSMYSDAAGDGEGPLYGVRVLDLTQMRAGPTCVRALADMGADVVQVASPGGVDLSRFDSYNLNRNKRSIVIDLAKDAGYAVLLDLVARADVLVENFRPSVKYRLDIDPQTLWKTNPRLVYGSISGFGQEGPYRDRPGLDQIAQGLGGLMSVTGLPGSGPVRAGIAVADTGAGMTLAQGILAALVARNRTGRGQWVHTSLLETMISMMDFQAIRWLADAEIPPQAGNGHPTSFPGGGATVRTKDGYVNIAPMMPFDGFCALIDAESIAEDPRFSSAESRRAHAGALQEALDAAMAARTTAEWVDRLAAHIPCGPVLSVDETFADPQVRYLEMTRQVAVPQGGSMDVLRLPLTFSDTPVAIRSGVMTVGTHAREILGELDYDSTKIEELLDEQAVAESRRFGQDLQGL